MTKLLRFESDVLWLDAATLSVGRCLENNRASCHIGISGGKTPENFYRHLRDASIPFDRIDWWIVDERCVSPDSEDRNEKMMRAALFEGSADRLHGWGNLSSPEKAAVDMEQALRSSQGAWPRLDLLFLGIGDDGHTASLFPDSPELMAVEPLALATQTPHLGHRRVTFSKPFLERSGEIVFLVRGAAKASMVERVARGDATIPAGSLIHPKQIILWRT